MRQNRTLADLRAIADRENAVGAFVQIVKAMAVGKNVNAAFAYGEKTNQPPVVMNVLKSAVVAGSTTSLPELEGSSAITTAYLDTITNRSVFARALTDGALLSVPFNSRVTVAAGELTAVEILEGRGTRVRAVDLSDEILVPTKVGLLVVATDKLWASTDPQGVAYVERMLREAVATGIDKFVLTQIAGATNYTADIGSLSEFATAFRSAMALVATNGNSRPYIACSVQAANQLIALDDAGRIDPWGGSIFSIPTVITGGLTAGLQVFDAAGVAGALEGIDIDASNAGTVEMDDATTQASDTPTPTTVVSLFQSHSTAIRAIARLGVKKARATVSSSITFTAP